jgi:hypothetical protein
VPCPWRWARSVALLKHAPDLFAVQSIEIVRQGESAAAESERPRLFIWASERHEPGHRFPCAGDNDLLASGGLVHESGEVGFRFVNVD